MLKYSLGYQNEDGVHARPHYVYDAGAAEWSRLADLSAVRYLEAGLAAFDGVVYVCGGFDDNDSVQSCEKWSADTDTWSTFTSPSVARHFQEMVILLNLTNIQQI